MKTTLKSTNFNELKKFMANTHTIQNWNDRREKAKELFAPELINQLDASDLVKTL